jgi:hypothetical protein
MSDCLGPCDFTNIVAQSHTPHDCCVRFAVVVAFHAATLATGRALPLTHGRTRTGWNSPAFLAHQTFRRLHACPDCFRRELSPDGSRTHWKAPPFTAHAESGSPRAAPAKAAWCQIADVGGDLHLISAPATPLIEPHLPRTQPKTFGAIPFGRTDGNAFLRHAASSLVCRMTCSANWPISRLASLRGAPSITVNPAAAVST